MSFKIQEIKKLPDWEAEITGEIPLDFLNESRKEALKHLNKHVSLPGFRPGLVPEDVLVKTVGVMGVLEETAEVALGKEYGNIVEATKLKPLTRPQISVTKLAPGIPLEFKARFIIEPEFDLPNYKKIASEVAEEDMEKKRLKIVEEIRKETKLELPEKFINAEATHMLEHFKQDLEKAGIKWNLYLEQIKKTEDEVKKELKESVANRAKTELILSKIAEKENLKTFKEVFELLDKRA